jgi:hypothetical protein
MVLIRAGLVEAQLLGNWSKMMISIGIAGTAKNTGKTTTLQALLEEAHRAGIRFGITSIGYDGEWKDNITGLPKPRIHVQEGILVGVAAACLAASTCRIGMLEGTGITTALGEVLIGEVTEPGLLITAGPNKIRDLHILQEKLKEKDCRLLFVDGALNRIVPFSLTDGIILATGAARNPNISALAEDARIFDRVLRFPFHINAHDKVFSRVVVGSTVTPKHELPFMSLLTVSQAEQISLLTDTETKYIHIPGALQTDALLALIESLLQKPGRPCIHIPTALQLIPGGSLENACTVLYRWLSCGGSWSVAKSIPLLAMTVNPFYPAYRFSGKSYENAYVNALELIDSVRNKVSVPVFDLKVTGCESLWQIVAEKYF